MSAPIGIEFQDQATAAVVGQAWAAGNTLGCTTNVKECMKGKTEQEIIDAMTVSGPVEAVTLLQQGLLWDAMMPWKPHVDGNYVPSKLIDAADNGLYDSNFIIMGTTTEELIPHTYNLLSSLSYDSFQLIVGLWQGAGNVATLEEQYLSPAEVDNAGIDYRTALGYMITDFIFTCPTRYIASRLPRYSSRYMYVFDQPKPGFDAAQASGDPSCYTIACHTADRSYLFNTNAALGYNITDDEAKLSEDLQDLWTSFGRDGKPGTACSPAWPQYCTRDPKAIQFRAGDTQIIDNYRGDICDTWDEILYG